MVNISKLQSTICKTGTSQVGRCSASEASVKNLSETLAGVKPKLNPELMFSEIKMPKRKIIYRNIN